jgi:hypothetical protein
MVPKEYIFCMLLLSLILYTDNALLGELVLLTIMKISWVRRNKNVLFRAFDFHGVIAGNIYVIIFIDK